MANVRAINKDKYNISNYRFRELYYFCLQYEEWKQELKEKRNPLKAIQYSEAATSGTPGNPTANIGIECAELSHKCNMIEQAAQAADAELWEYILYAVTNENVTFNFLKTKKNMPCERDRYYNNRRKFYFILDKKMRKQEGE